MQSTLEQLDHDRSDSLELLEKRSSAGLTEENSERIAFVLSCLCAQAINTAELRQWARQVLEETDSPPQYLTALVQFNQPLSRIYNLIDFAPNRAHTQDASLGISGIAFRRNRQPFDHPIIRQEALRNLEQNPEIEEKFRSEFPFLAW